MQLIEDYEYKVRVKAREAFRNMLAREGVTVSEGDGEVSFTARKLLNLKAWRRRGIVGAYTIAIIQRSKKVIERG